MAVVAREQARTTASSGEGLAGRILSRLEEMKSARVLVNETWRECFEYSFPMRAIDLAVQGAPLGPQLNIGYGRAKQAQLMDSTATDSCRILSAALMGGLVPANSRWFSLLVPGVDDAGKRWLDIAAEAQWKNIHAANFDAAGYECMIDAVVAGMCALYVDEDRVRGGYLFEQWPLAQCFFASSKAGGRVDIVYREVELTAMQAVNEYGPGAVSQAVRDAAEKRPGEKFKFIHAIYPRDVYAVGARLSRNLPIASCHVEVGTKRVVRESGYHEHPVVVPRWMQLPGSCMATGPMLDALPDAKTCNESEFYALANEDMQTSGMYGAVDDGVLNARTVRIGPRRVIVMADKDSFFPITPAGNIRDQAIRQESRRAQIRKVLLADHLALPDKAGMTALEVATRVDLLRQALGPIYGRLQSEFLQPLVERTFGLAFRAGVFPPPPRSLQGREFSVQYLSPLARAQQLADVNAMDRYELGLMQKAQVMPDALDVYDWDEADRMRAEKLGVPLKTIREREDVEEMRKARAQAQAQAAQSQMMLEGAKLVAKSGGGSMLPTQ